jgi:hypothetical protein
MVEERPPEVFERAWKELTRAGFSEMGEHWHRVMLPRHFEAHARERYGYKPRTKRYAIRKNMAYAKGKAVAASNVDLVFTGLLRQSMQSVGTVRAFPTRATVSMTGPRYITMRPYQSDHPDLAAEVTKITEDEAQELSNLLNESVTRRLEALREPAVTVQ